MDISNMLAELKLEREQIGEAIIALERLALVDGNKRPGRPPIWMVAMKDSPKRGRPPGSKNKSTARTEN